MDILKYPFKSNEILKNRKMIKKELLADGSRRLDKRIAVLGGSTVTDIVAVLELFLLDYGIAPSFYISEYGRYWQDAMFDNPELEAFSPDLIYVHTTARNISVPFPRMADSAETIETAVETQMNHFTSMWESLRRRYHCPMIQNNFEMPYFRLLGNQDVSNPHGRTNFIARLNMKFNEYAQQHTDFYIHDIQYLSSVYGLEKWSDPLYWYLYKYALCVPAIPEFAFNLANIIKSLFGKNKKAFALDLDNTLWGGVVGDDGVDGLMIGPELPAGQAFYEFQKYLKAHKELGILLTVCSKNDMENAVAGLHHPDGVLRPDDFTMIQANWENKADNLSKIAAALNILPESIVFVDDNPAEREIVRSFLPDAAVPDPGNIEDSIRILNRSGFFELTTFSEDDLKRGEMYQANMKRLQEQQQFADYADYLVSLRMKARIHAFESIYLQRITQLVNKSNQFNLTTRRYTEAEIQQISRDSGYIDLYGKLIDKFGDNGVVSVIIGRIDGTVLHVELWMMSCRVLKRDMEFAMLDALAEVCRGKGIRQIRGYYYPTAKNGMVKDLYSVFGFQKVREEPDGSTVWQLDLNGYQKRNHVITIEKENS